MAVVMEDAAGDASNLLRNVFGDNISPIKLAEAQTIARATFTRQVEILNSMFPGRTIGITENAINQHFFYHINRLLSEKENRIIVFLDRHIVQDIDALYPNRIFRFSLTRILTNSNSGWGMCPVRPRPEDPSFDEQLDSIDARLHSTPIGSLQNASVIMADDVADTLSTETAAIELFEARDATVEKEEGIYSYRSYKDRGVNGEPIPFRRTPDLVRKNILFEVEGKVVTAEQREFTPLGGRLLRSLE